MKAVISRLELHYHAGTIIMDAAPGRFVDVHSRPPIKLRSARASDLGFAEQLYLDTMLPLLAALGSDDAEALQARFAHGYRGRRSKIVCSGADDVGWMQVSRIPTGFHLDQLHLLPGWRDRGIGGALLRRLLARAGRAGADVRLDVIHGNPAMALYRRLGFVVVEADHEKSRMAWRRDAP